MQLPIILVFIFLLLQLIFSLYLYFKQRSLQASYTNLFKTSDGAPIKGLKTVIESLIAQSQQQEIEIESVKKALINTDTTARSALQKTGLIRFNPFTDTGGNHSFSLCLLNQKNDGIVITAIHGREGTRLYTKIISNAKSNQTLSSEENKALAAAVKNTDHPS